MIITYVQAKEEYNFLWFNYFVFKSVLLKTETHNQFAHA